MCDCERWRYDCEDGEWIVHESSSSGEIPAWKAGSYDPIQCGVLQSPGTHYPHEQLEERCHPAPERRGGGRGLDCFGVDEEAGCLETTAAQVLNGGELIVFWTSTPEFSLLVAQVWDLYYFGISSLSFGVFLGIGTGGRKRARYAR